MNEAEVFEKYCDLVRAQRQAEIEHHRAGKAFRQAGMVLSQAKAAVAYFVEKHTPRPRKAFEFKATPYHTRIVGSI